MRKKNIWVFSHYAEPPDGNWTNPYELFKALVQNGHKLTIFASSFSHHKREDIRLQSGEKYKEQNFEGVRFIFIRTTPYYKSKICYFLNFVSYALRAYKISHYYKERPDIIIGSSPPPFCALIAFIVSRRKKAKFFYEVVDLWPQFFVEVGAFSNWHPITIGLRFIEKVLSRKADKILALWTRMDLYFQKYGISHEKIVWMPMGINCKEITDELIYQRKDRCSFAVMYRGRFGLTQDMKLILQAAKILQEGDYKNIYFLLVGEGPEKENLIRTRDVMGLKNMKFRNFLPKDQMRKDMAEADVFIGSLPDLPCFSKYGMISTKLLDYLSAHRPIIFTTTIKDNLVAKSGAGFILPPNDPQAMAKAIIKIATMPSEERAKMADKGVRYIKKNHDVKLLARKLESLL